MGGTDRSRMLFAGFILARLAALFALAGIAAVPAKAQRNAPEPTREARQACVAIAKFADHGARTLRSADLAGRDTLVDLRNNGRPQRIYHRYDVLSSAHSRYLADEDGKSVQGDTPYNDYFEQARWADDYAVLLVDGRIWEVAWDEGLLDHTAALVAATDGSASCHFLSVWQPASVRILAAEERWKAPAYRRLVRKGGTPPPSSQLDAASLPAHENSGSFSVTIHPTSWRVDLEGRGRTLTLVQVEYSSGAGKGCDFITLGVLGNQTVTSVSFPAFEGPTIFPPDPVLTSLIGNLLCRSVAATPIIDRDNRAYVLFDNVDQGPGKGQAVTRVRLLAGVRDGKMQALARLTWALHNTVESAPER